MRGLLVIVAGFVLVLLLVYWLAGWVLDLLYAV